VVLNSEGPADADDGEESVGGILNGLLHVLAEVMHRCRRWSLGRESVLHSPHSTCVPHEWQKIW